MHAVWELTFRCDHACAHCGSRAGPAQRPRELGRDEVIATADRLADLGTRAVTLIGGEAYLSPHFYTAIRALRARDVRVSLQTGGLGITPTRVRRMRDAGLASIGFSIDGPADVHDVLRDRPGSWEAVMRGVANAREVGFLVTANTQVNALNVERLRETARFLEGAGVRGWRCQLTAPMGRAADHPAWILQPWRVVEVIDTLAALQTEAAERTRAAGRDVRGTFDIQIANNLGYYGLHEILLRSTPGGTVKAWKGCVAGRYGIGIESDGTVKGCPSLPTAPYAGGNLLETPLEELWDQAASIRFARERTVDELWGFCRTCLYAEVCRGGCSFTAHSTLGRRGNNPFCYHRVETLAKRGVRERLEHMIPADGQPYDFGRFRLVEEPMPR